MPGFNEEAFVEKAKQWFDITSFPVSPNGMVKEYETYKDALWEAGRNRTSFAFFLHGSDQWRLLSLKEGMKGEMGVDLHDSLKKLDVVVLFPAGLSEMPWVYPGRVGRR